MPASTVASIVSSIAQVPARTCRRAPKQLSASVLGRPGASLPPHAAKSDLPAPVAAQLESRTESVIADIESELASITDSEEDLVATATEHLADLNAAIDEAYVVYFDVGEFELEDGSMRNVGTVSEARMQELGRSEPKVRRPTYSLPTT